MNNVIKWQMSEFQRNNYFAEVSVLDMTMRLWAIPYYPGEGFIWEIEVCNDDGDSVYFTDCSQISTLQEAKLECVKQFTRYVEGISKINKMLTSET